MKIKFILPALAFVFAIAGALVTTATANSMLLSAYAQVPDDPSTEEIDETACVSGTVQESDCPEANGTVQCTILVSSIARPAFQNPASGGGNTCQTPALVRIP